MEKLITHLRPNEGVNLEEFWKEWGEKYAKCYAGQPGLVRYVISRFKEGHMRQISLDDNPDWLWGMEEFWFEDRQSYEKIQETLVKDEQTRAILEEFQSQLSWQWAGWVEERIIVDSGYTELTESGKNLVKLQVTFKLREGKDDDESWRLWIVGHSQDHLHIGVRKYALNRVKDVLLGDAGSVWGMPQIWYDSKEACDFDHKEHMEYNKNHPDQQEIFKDFHERTQGNWGVYMEEKIIQF